MLDGNVLLRQKRDEVPKGTLSCPNRNMANSQRHCHNEGVRLLPPTCDCELIQQTLVRNDLTGAALYKEKDVAEMIQPLRFEPKEEPRENIEEEGEYDLGMPIEKWVSMSQKTSSEDFNELKKLAELAKQEKKKKNGTK